MATRLEREKQQRQNEKHKNILATILSREENKFCADCLSKGPRWASWNLGVLLCIRCSGLHRSLGVHISRVKSVNLDTWTKEQMVNFCSRGNGWAKDNFEARLPKDFKRPQSDSSLEYFIRDKYEKKKYLSQTEICLRSIKDLGLMEDGTPESSQKNRRKEQKNKENVSIISIAKPRSLKPTSPSIPRPKSLPQLPQHNVTDTIPAKAHTPAPTTDDLLGLSSPVSVNAPVSVSISPAPAPPPSADLTEDLFGPLSSYSGQALTMTMSMSSPDLLNSVHTSASPEPSAPEPSEKKMSKDSILSLYSQGTSSQPVNPMISQANFTMPAQNTLPYQQPAMQYNQSFPPNMQNMNMQGMGSAYSAQQQQQMMAMQQQMQMQQMSQQMSNVGLSGMSNAPGNMGYSMMGQQGQSGYPPQQQIYAGMPNGHPAMGQPVGMMQMGAGYGQGAMMGGAMPNMGMSQGQYGVNGTTWGSSAVPPAATGVNSGHTLSTQLWK